MPKVKSQKKSRRSRQQEVYTVERIVDKRLNNGQVGYYHWCLMFSCSTKVMHAVGGIFVKVDRLSRGREHVGAG